MKVTINPDNLIVIDGDDIAEIAKFVNALANGMPLKRKAMSVLDMAHIPPEAIKKPKRKPGRPRKVSDRSLSPALAAVHKHLVDNDSPEGVSSADLSNAFGTKPAAMSLRLRELRKRGFADSVTHGKWRAVR